ncbi:MAG: glutaredoxin family protein [Alcanivoracaceae bacterium]
MVYGRDGCAYTTKLRRYLTERGVPFEYRVVDESELRKICMNAWGEQESPRGPTTCR